jgi:hypothetical protein
VNEREGEREGEREEGGREGRKGEERDLEEDEARVDVVQCDAAAGAVGGRYVWW